MRANWECMKKRDERKRKTSVCAHQQKIDQHRHRRVCILLSLYVSSSYEKNISFRIPENECVYFALLFPFYFSHPLCLDVQAKKKKHTHKTPFTSHIDCIKTAFLCIKISDSHCECMAMSHKQEREGEKKNERAKTKRCSVLRYDIQSVLADRVKKPIQ